MGGSRKSPRGGRGPDSAWKIRSFLLLVLAIGTCALYSPIHTHDFINYDDFDYVLKNPHISTGLSWQTIRWSFTSLELANWHPLTWLSHALDVELFGMDAGYHHITSLALHTITALLLFLLLQWATKSVWRSFFVAAFFAWHPLNVQSVAWVAERKNVLSTLFYFAAIGAYAWYARQPNFRRLLWVLGIFILALASKPMAVSLPFVLLLLDYWPLQRVAGWAPPSSQFPVPQRTPGELILEKWPLFVFSAGSSAITVLAQRSGGAMRSLQSFPLRTRLANAVYSYAVYIGKTLWPTRLAVYYPHPGTSLPLWKPWLAAVLLGAISLAIWSQRRARPYLLSGWLWFLGTLVPVIGIVQVGDQALADRYAYLPLIGIFVIVVWGTADVAEALRLRPQWIGATAAVALGALLFASFQEIGYWKNSGTVWSRALDVTPGNLHIEKELANALALLGDTQGVMPHLLNIETLDPGDATVHANLGSCYAMRGETQEAIREFETAISLTNHGDLTSEDRQSRSSAQLNLGFVYTDSKDYAHALVNLKGAVESNPTMIDSAMENVGRSLASSPSEIGFLRLALLLQARGNGKDASSILQKAIQANPEYADSRMLLSYFDRTAAISKATN